MFNTNTLPNVDAIAAAVLRRMGEIASKEVGTKHDASGTPASTGYLHGPNGLLRYPGVDPAVFHTVVGSMGIMGQLQWTPSVFMNPLFETITGITAGDSTERDEVCEDAPTAGVKKGCIVQAPFGWIQRGTQEVDVTRLGQRLDRADPTDLFMVGSPMNNPIMPGGMDGLTLSNDQLINEWANLLSNRAVAMHRKLSQVLWTGNPTNNTNGYLEPVGLQTLVATGYVDAVTGTTCPSMDSLVHDFNYTVIEQNMGDLVARMTAIARYVRSLAMRTGMDPVRWAWVMREEAFYQVTRAYACAYLTSGQCATIDSASQRLIVDARDNVAMRDDMFNNRYLIIDGARWPVIFDDGIPEEGDADTAELQAGQFASDIFLLPFSVLGGRSTLYGEYFQFQNPSITSVFGQSFLGRTMGAFLEVPRQTNNCFVLDIHVKPRLILRTPWLAAKITNVAYEPLLHTRQPFPDDPYFVNGGVVGERTAPTYQVHWD